MISYTEVEGDERKLVFFNFLNFEQYIDLVSPLLILSARGRRMIMWPKCWSLNSVGKVKPAKFM